MESIISRQRGKIKAIIIDYENGRKLYNGVKAVRIHSADYTLLIMEDYTPALGKIEGDITLFCEDEEVAFNGIVGFYKHEKNVFTLIVDEHIAEKESSAEEVQ